MKKDIVLHSTDPYLLMRMFTDLQMDGRFFMNIKYNKKIPFWARYLKLYMEDNTVCFFSINSCVRLYNKSIPLTESNYLATLKMILE